MPKPASSAKARDPHTRFQRGVVERLSRKTIQGAEYNPRTISAEARRRLRENIAKVGLLGPAVVVNRTTGRILSGHQRIAVLDTLEKRDDYELDCTVVEMTEQEEREQNVFMNATGAQGDFDVSRLGTLLEEFGSWDAIDRAGFDRMTVVDTFADFALPDTVDPFASSGRSAAAQAAIAEVVGIAEQREAERPPPAHHSLDAIKAQKKTWREQHRAENDTEHYAVVVFASREERERFATMVGYPPATKYMDGPRLIRWAARAEGQDVEG